MSLWIPSNPLMTADRAPSFPQAVSVRGETSFCHQSAVFQENLRGFVLSDRAWTSEDRRRLTTGYSGKGRWKRSLHLRIRLRRWYRGRWSGSWHAGRVGRCRVPAGVNHREFGHQSRYRKAGCCHVVVLLGPGRGCLISAPAYRERIHFCIDVRWATTSMFWRSGRPS
jgi:hypothetical protein